MGKSGGSGAEVGPVATGGSDPARRLDDRLALEQVQSRLPSLVAGLVREGVLVWSAARGDTGLSGEKASTTATQYRIGSISKTFTAVEVMRLRDEGAIDVSDLVGDHLEELSGRPVTIAHLLSHTSGLRAETSGPWWERTPGVSFAELAMSSIQERDFLWRPGRRFHYSNTGFAVLGELVARKRRAPFSEVISSELLAPLGMERTTFRPVAPHAQGLAVHPHVDAVLTEPEHDARAMAPAGQLWSTIGDLARWSEVLTGRRPEILAAATVAEMTEPIGVTDMPDQPWAAAYGLGLQLWNQGGQRRYGHSGSMPGFVAWLAVDQASRDVVVALTNSTGGFRPVLCDDLLALGASQLGRGSVPFRPGGAGSDESALELLGVWYWGPREYRMSLRADAHLELRGLPSGRDAAFRPNGDGSYTGEYGYFDGERLEPKKRPDGSVAYLDIASFVFTRTPYDPGAEIPGGLDKTGWRAG
jgi:CubicO group peptidase (beta-lactamase class C family)